MSLDDMKKQCKDGAHLYGRYLEALLDPVMQYMSDASDLADVIQFEQNGKISAIEMAAIMPLAAFIGMSCDHTGKTSSDLLAEGSLLHNLAVTADLLAHLKQKAKEPKKETMQ